MIEKNIPQKFVSDKDERLLKVGDMIEAQNITVTQRGEGTESVIKTFKGVDSATTDAGSIIVSSASTVIGKVEDPQRDFIYFFIAGNSGDDNDKIVQYNPSTNKYKLVHGSSFLAFDHTGFVKADVLNKDFERNGGLQTIIYFTDNVNPPRKINVDRAIAGDYDGLSTSELEIALGSMRAAPTIPPTFRFDTDTTISNNNFRKEIFQFATQIVYQDGEVSALSPYSKIAVSQAAVFGALEEGTMGGSSNVQNLCLITHNISLDHPDLKKVRILARSGNNGNFFIVDEFDPNSNLRRDLYSNNVEVYNKDTTEYKFYNDILGTLVSSVEANKLFDAVPFKAEGQSITGSRLMYSNYQEGRANVTLNPSHYSITPKYNSSASGLVNFAENSDATNMFATSSMNITFDLDPAANISAGTVFPAGTQVNISFPFKPQFTLTDTGGDSVIKFDSIIDTTEDNVQFLADTVVFPAPTDTTKKVTLNVITPEEFSGTTQLANFVQSQLDDIDEFFLDYVIVNQQFVNPNGVNLGADFIADMTIRVFWKFGETSTSSNDQIVFEPRIESMKLVAIAGGTSFGGGNHITATLGTSSLSNINSSFTNPFNEGDPYLNNGLIIDNNIGNQQNEHTFASITNTIGTSDLTSIISSNSATLSFKHTESHVFGIVFFDKFGRSGFVNELGSVYVKAPHERSTPDLGPVSMEFDLSNTNLNSSIPTWADSYQIVYAGSSAVDTFQYTVGGAYARRLTSETSSIHDLDTSTHNIFVSLKTLDNYKRDKEVVRDYSFTKGDKLRILTRRATNNSGDEFPSSSQGDVIEFDVLGVKTVTDADDDFLQKLHASPGSGESNPLSGTFLVISSPQVESTANQTTSSNINKYEGFDWYSITNTDYNGSVSSPNKNHWNKAVAVEIVTPRPSTAEKVYYEIGERRRLGSYRAGTVSNFGPAFTVRSGDVYIRPTTVIIPKYDSAWIDLTEGATAVEDPETWVSDFRYLESHNASDIFESESWDKGRVHTVFRDAATVTRYNSITFSDAYADDTGVLNLSSFNPGLANFFDLPSEHGACRYIGNKSDSLAAVQEQRLSLVTVNKDIIETGSQSGLISLSTSVLGNASQYGADYGTQNPESVLIRDGVVYFVDKSRRAIVRATQQGMEIISNTDIKSFIEDQFSLWPGNRIVSGYDPEDNVYYMTLEPSGSYAGLTVGYNMGKFWQGQYTFFPSCYAAINDSFIICDYVNNLPNSSEDFIIHSFSSQNSNLFPGSSTRAESKLTVVSNSNPSMVKQYNSLSIESDSAWTTTLESSTGQTTGNLVFSEKEDAFYADISGDTSSNSLKHLIGLGEVSSVSGSTVTLSSSLKGVSIPTGYSVFINDGTSSVVDISRTVVSFDRVTRELTLSADVSLLVDSSNLIFISANQQLTGDNIRGHFCKVKCSKTPTGTSREELYAVNMNFVPSKANHSSSS